MLLLGFGYCAKAMLAPLRDAGFTIIATTRDAAQMDTLKRMGIAPVFFNGDMTQELRKAISQATHILSSIPPKHGVDPVISALDNKALSARPEWVGYLSATSVYGDRAGQWAFEDELLYPTTKRGRARIEAELSWLETGWPVHVFRLAGIYGPDIHGTSRNPFERLRTGKARAVIKAGHIVNRIHVDDITRAILASMAHPNPATVYNIADGHPAPPQDVLHFAADLLSTPRAIETTINDPKVSEMARSFYSETKRVDITRAKRDLGWSPQYPDYKAGLMSIAQHESKQTAHVYLGGYITVPDNAKPSVESALPTHITTTRAEVGCIRFDVTPDPHIKGRYNVFEIFDSSASFNAHQNRSADSPWADASKNCPRNYTIIGL